jgi:hypothetical protein
MPGSNAGVWRPFQLPGRQPGVAALMRSAKLHNLCHSYTVPIAAPYAAPLRARLRKSTLTACHRVLCRDQDVADVVGSSMLALQIYKNIGHHFTVPLSSSVCSTLVFGWDGLLLERNLGFCVG